MVASVFEKFKSSVATQASRFVARATERTGHLIAASNASGVIQLVFRNASFANVVSPGRDRAARAKRDLAGVQNAAGGLKSRRIGARKTGVNFSVRGAFIAKVVETGDESTPSGDWFEASLADGAVV